MTVAGLKEANLQHRNEIKHAAFIADTKQEGKIQKSCMCCAFMGPQLSVLDLKTGMVLPSLSSSGF